MSKYVQIANLPEPGSQCPEGLVLIVSGWGQDIYDTKRPGTKLYAVKQECVSLSECPSYQGDETYDLCVTDSGDRRNSACHGDSGGDILRINYPI